MKINKEMIGWIASSIISIILANLGVAIIEKEKYMGIITIIIAFVLLYITYYALQIKTNEERIKELSAWKENKEEIINTLRDIVILKKVSKIK